MFWKQIRFDSFGFLRLDYYYLLNCYVRFFICMGKKEGIEGQSERERERERKMGDGEMPFCRFAVCCFLFFASIAIPAAKKVWLR